MRYGRPGLRNVLGAMSCSCACEQRAGTGWAEPKILGTPHARHVLSGFNHFVDHCLPLFIVQDPILPVLPLAFSVADLGYT